MVHTRTAERKSLAKLMGARMRVARKRSQIPAKEVAQRMGTYVAQLYRYENGQNEIGLYRLALFATICGEGIESLVAGLEDHVTLSTKFDDMDLAA